MFQSYQFNGFCTTVAGDFSFNYQIIDSDFGTVLAFSPPNRIGVGVGLDVGIAVIDIYSKKGLPVAPNLIRALLWYQNQIGYTLDQLVEWNKLYNPRWSEVEKDMQKYLLFS